MEIIHKKINEIHDAVHYYYPLGFEYFGLNYKGFAAYKEILTKKINDIIEKKETQWTLLVQEMKNMFKDDFFDMNYLQFPSHMARLKIIKETNQKYDYQLSLIINVSLLCNYYTVFFESEFIYKNYTEKIVKPSLRFFHLKQKTTSNEVLDQIELIHQKIKLLYADYEYINHQTLFQHEIKSGFLYTEGVEFSEPPYFLYNFLFDGFLKNNFLYVFE